METETKEILTPKEAARFLGIHLVTVYRLLKKGGIPAMKIGGQWRFKRDFLNEWMNKEMTKRGSL